MIKISNLDLIKDIGIQSAAWFSQNVVGQFKDNFCGVCGNFLKTPDDIGQGFHMFHNNEDVETLTKYKKLW